MKIISIIGPESTGKTMLASALAKQYACPWLPEYARTYIESLTRPYNYQDVEFIAQKQVAAQKQAIATFAHEKPYLFLDTDLIITKVWFLHVYQTCPNWLQDAIVATQIDAFLLCQADLPWEADPVRENGHLRTFFYDWYQREIEALDTPFFIVNGVGAKRIQTAVKAIEDWCAK